MFASHSNFHPSDAKLETKINKILASMTIEEKIEILGGSKAAGNTIANKRIGIPEFRLADGPVGVHWFTEMSTTYPALILAAASFDRDLIQTMGIALGRDCRARGIHILLAPGVNMYRSALCGRNFEYCGEDPYLAGQIASAYIRGVQSQGISATIKHFALNFQEYDRNNVSSDVDERTLREIYLPAFEAAVKEGGTGCLMTSYNLVNGIHTSEHKGLITDILKMEWGFDGVVMSDWNSVYDTVNSVNAGLDLEMPWKRFMDHDKILPAIAEGKIKTETIDDKVRRLLRLAFCFGWMENDIRDYCIPVTDPQTMQTSLDVARNGMVLLKNSSATLPFDRKSLKKIAVVGPSAHPAVITGGGSANNPPSHTVSMLEAITHLAGPEIKVVHSVGVDPTRAYKTFDNSMYFSEEGGQGLSAEYFNNADLSGVPTVRRIDPQLSFKWGEFPPMPEITAANYSVRWTARIRLSKSGLVNFHFKCIQSSFRVFLEGKCILDKWDKVQAGVVEKVSLNLDAGKEYQFKLEFRKAQHWVLIQAGYEMDTAASQDYDHALSLISECDATVVCCGFNDNNEGEGADRPFQMASELEEFILTAAKLCPRTVVVLTAGGNVDMSRWLDKVQALLVAWYPGQEGGSAVAEILFGAVNPSGKLPVTFEKRLEDRGSFDSYHDADKDKRVFLKDGIFHGYRYFDANNVKPLFPFGFGLSYTTFAYENLRLTSTRFDPAKGMEVSFDIVNTGNRDGAESAQVYIRDVKCSVERPVKELKGFAKVFLKAGERKRVSVSLDRRALEFWHPEKRAWTAEPGEFEVLAGASCEDIRLKAKFNL